MDDVRKITLKRVHTLFGLAKKSISKEPKLAQRYAQIARRLAMRTKVRLPSEYRRMICRHCKSFIYPGVNCRVRMQQKREPHMVITCQVCGKPTRILLRQKHRHAREG